MEAKSVSVVSPARNEEENIREFIEKTSNSLDKLKIDYEIIIVNDASTDRTGTILSQLKTKYRRLKVIDNKKRKGLTGALNVGFENTGKPVIIFLPSDLESNPAEDIPKLITAFNENYDVVVGWRHNKKENIAKRITTYVFNSFSSFLFGVKLHDLGWVKCFKKEILNEIEPLRSDWHRFLVVLAFSAGYKVKEIKTNFYPRKKGKSNFGKFGFLRVPGAFFDLIVVKFFTVFSKKPIHLFGFVGLLFIISGFVLGMYILYLHLIVKYIVNRLPLIILTSLFIFVGILLFCIGILAEYLVSIREMLRIRK